MPNDTAIGLSDTAPAASISATETNFASTSQLTMADTEEDISLMNIPTEIRSQIGGAFSRAELSALCRTCKRLNAIYTPEFYASFELGRLRPMENDDLSSRQGRFLETLVDHPDIARHVKSLKWAFAVPGYGYRADDDSAQLARLWNVLRTLINVRHLEVSEGEPSRLQKFIPPDLTLFPNLTSLCISGFSGYLTDRLVYSILPSSKAGQLQHLHFDMMGLQTNGRGNHKGTTAFFESLVGKCTGLKSMIVNQAEIPHFPLSHKLLWEEHEAHERLINSCRGTMETLYFKTLNPVPDSKRRDMTDRLRWNLGKGAWFRLQQVTVLSADTDTDRPCTCVNGYA